MSLSTHNDLDRSAGAIQAEETLRLIASLPAPEGIEERVKAGVHAADRQARVVSWPVSASSKARWTQVSVPPLPAMNCLFNFLIRRNLPVLRSHMTGVLGMEILQLIRILRIHILQPVLIRFN